MSIIGGYGTGSSASAVRYSTVDELLNQLPDNNANLINASDIRDSIFTLWESIGDVQVIASQSASFSVSYTNTTPVPQAIGGIPLGMSFSAKSMQEMWDMLLYPYVAPVPVLTSLSSRQYGAPLPVTLNWSVTKNSYAVTSIVVDGQSFVPSGAAVQTGTKSTTGTHSVTPGVSATNTFNMSVSDGTTTPTTSVSLTWMNKRYWGRVDLSSVGNPDLSLNPGSASSVGAYITSTIIKNLTGASVSPGNELATTKNKTYTGINGAGWYLIFAFPTSFGTPAFTVNGLSVTAYTKVKSAFSFENEYGFSGTPYDVWVSNTAQNSPFNLVIS